MRAQLQTFYPYDPIGGVNPQTHQMGGFCYFYSDPRPSAPSHAYWWGVYWKLYPINPILIPHIVTKFHLSFLTRFNLLWLSCQWWICFVMSSPYLRASLSGMAHDCAAKLDPFRRKFYPPINENRDIQVVEMLTIKSSTDRSNPAVWGELRRFLWLGEPTFQILCLL